MIAAKEAAAWVHFLRPVFSSPQLESQGARVALALEAVPVGRAVVLPMIDPTVPSHV